MISVINRVNITSMKKICIIGGIFLFCFTCLSLSAAVHISNIRIYPNKTSRIVFDMSGPTTYKQFSLYNPARIVIDFRNVSHTLKPSHSAFIGTPIKDIRFAKKANHTLRIVIDLKTTVKTHTFQLKPQAKRGYRTVLDLTPLNRSTNFTKHRSTTKVKKKTTPPLKNLRNIIVVLDPGHGGRDPGATGPRGTHEKRITLAIALNLRRDLQKIPGIKVYMTRTRDIYPTLSQRLYLARRVKADLFISIHADAYRNRSAHGATVFALSQGRATSEAARWIAERENKSELLGGINLTDKSHLLRSVLVDLSQTATIGSSLKLGKSVVQQLDQITKMHTRRVEQASLYVLTSPDIPAILVETGFISNPDEERLLNKPAHRKKIASAIEHGVKNYLIANPIQNTIFTAQIFGAKYIVRHGDSISKIATKFKVSTAQLRQINQLKSNTLFTGQVIRIPSKHG